MLEQHFVEARGLGLVPVLHRPVIDDRLSGEHDVEQAGRSADPCFHAGVAHRVREPVHEPAPVVEQPRIGVVLAQDPERRKAGGGRDGIAAQGPYLRQEAVLAHRVAIELRHDLLAAGQPRQRKPSADDLADGAQIRHHPVVLLRPSVGEPEAGDDLVEGQWKAMPPGQGPQPFEKPGPWRDHPLERLDDHPGERIVVLLDDRGDRIQIVVGRDQHLVPDRLRDPGRVRDGLGAVAAPPGREAHQGVVVHAVVAALELQDLRAPAERAHRPHREERGLGAAAREADLVRARDRLANRLGQQDAGLAVGEEGGAVLELPAHRLDDPRMPVAEEHRAGADQEVDVLLARRIAHPGAGALGDHEVGPGVPEAPSGQEGPGLLAQCGARMDLLFHARPPVSVAGSPRRPPRVMGGGDGSTGCGAE